MLREKAFWYTFDGCRKRNVRYGSADWCIPSTERITLADPFLENAFDQMTTLWEAEQSSVSHPSVRLMPPRFASWAPKPARTGSGLNFRPEFNISN